MNDYQCKLGQIVPASLPNSLKKKKNHFMFLCMYSPFYLFDKIHAVSGLTYISLPVILYAVLSEHLSLIRSSFWGRSSEVQTHAERGIKACMNYAISCAAAVIVCCLSLSSCSLLGCTLKQHSTNYILCIHASL